MRRRRDPDRIGSAVGAPAKQAGRPGGKALPRTLSKTTAGLAVQRKRQRTSGGRQGDEEAVAERGVAGGSSSVPRRAEMERAFGADFSDVRAHRGPEAREACNELGAEAYAYGDRVAFADEQPDPHTVAHELAHTVQQGYAGVQGHDAGLGPADLEREADAAADAAVRGEPVAIASAGTGRDVQKKSLFDGLTDFLSIWDEEEDFPTEKSNWESEVAEPGWTWKDEGEPETEATARGQRERKSTSTFGFDLSSFGLSWTDEETSEDQRRVDEAEPEKARAALETKRWKKRETRAELERRLDDQRHRLDRNEAEREALREDIEAQRQRAVGGSERELRTAEAELAALEREHEELTTTRDEMQKEREGLDAELEELGEDIARVEKKPSSSAELLEKWEHRETAGTGVEKTEWSGSLTEGSVGRTETSSYTTGEGDSLSRSTSHEATVGEGVELNREEQRSATRSEGDTEHTDTQTDTREGHWIAKDDGTVGLGYDRERKREHETKETFGEKGLESSASTKGWKKVSGGGTFTVNIVPAKGEKGQYEITVTIGLAGGGELGEEVAGQRKAGDEGSASGSLTGSAGATLTRTRRLSKEEVTRYVGELEKSEDSGEAEGDSPEASMIAKLAAGGADVPGTLVAGMSTLGSSSIAAGMQSGESVELELSAGAGVDLGASAKGGGKGGYSAGLSLGHSRDVKRTLKVSKVTEKERDLVDVTVSFGGSRETTKGVNASVGGGSVGGTWKDGGSSDRSVTFRLDPEADDYPALYDDIIDTPTREGLVALRQSPEMAEHVRKYTEKTSEEESFGFSGGLFGVLGLETEDASRRTSEKTVEGDSVEHTESGERGFGLDFDLFGIELAGVKETDSGTAEVKDGELTVDVSETEESRGLDAKWLGIGDWFTSKDTTSYLEKSLTEVYTRLSTYKIYPPDVDELVVRAGGSESKWQRCAIASYTLGGWEETLEAWMEVRRQLANPTPDPEMAKIDEDRAIALARAEAIAEFMSIAANGHEVMERCLREWGESRETEDIGTKYEFPDALKDLQTDYFDTRSKVKDVYSKLTGFGDDQDAAVAHLLELGAELTDHEAKIKSCEDFEDRRARMEMLAEIDDLEQDLYEARLTIMPVGANSEAFESAAARIDASRVRQLEVQMREFKDQEAELFAVADAARGSWWKPTDKLSAALEELMQLHEFWFTQVVELREAYEYASTPRDRWMVSAGPGEPRNEDYEPDQSKLDELYAMFHLGMPAEEYAAEHGTQGYKYVEYAKWQANRDRRYSGY